jgi:hypothetical protein
MIVVEGYDCTGKSTLVEKLKRLTGFVVTHSGGPPQDLNHVRRCLARCASRMTHPIVQDRVTHVSESVYGMLERHSMAALALSRLDDLRFCRLLVYCRPATLTIMDRLAVHERKEHDTDEHIRNVLRHAETLIAVYDTVICMARQYVDVFVYDYERAGVDLRLQSIVKGIEQ